MRWIVGASLRSRGLVVAVALGLLVFGVLQLERMPRDVIPEFTPTTVEIQTEALGLSAREVEEMITAPLEQDLLNGVAFLDTIRSESVPGLSRIELIFEEGTTLVDARQVVAERLAQAAVAFPNVSRPPQMLQPVSSTNRVMMIGLDSKDTSLIDMSVLARWTIQPALMGVPGVANVSIWGQREQQLQVQVDPAQLHARGLTLDQVIRTTGNALWVSPLTFLEASTPGTGGFYDTQSQRLGVQHTQPIKTPADLARVVIDAPPSVSPSAPPTGEAEGEAAAPPPPPPPPLRLGEVTTVREDHQPLIGDAVFPDGPGLLLVVEKFPGADALKVTEDLESELDGLESGLSGIEIDTSLFLPAGYIDSSGDNLRTALVIGLILLALTLGAFFGQLRTTFIILFALLLSLAAAVVLLHARGETLNVMVLAGLVLGLVVLIDDAVVSADGALRSFRRRNDDDEAGDAERALEPGTALRRIAKVVLDVRGPLLYSTVILLLALVPVLVLQGEMGAFLPPLVLSYAVAVVASMLVALTVAPALTILLLSKEPPAPRQSPVLRWLQPRYDRAFSRFGGSPRTGYVALGALLVIGVVTMPFLDRRESLVPEFKDRNLLIGWTGAPGTSLPEMRRISARAGEELRALPGVNNVGGHVGRAITGEQIVGTNSSELWVSIDASADYDDTVASIEEVVAGYPGIESSVLTLPRARIDSILTEPDGVEGKDLTVRVFGQNLQTLRAQAEEVSDAVAGVDGVDAPLLELPVLEPTLDVEVNLERAQALGIKPGDVRRAAATIFSGVEVGYLFEEQKVFQVVVWGTPATRGNIDNVRNLLIDKPDGLGQVRLGDVADVRVEPNPNVIRHEDVSRYIDVGVDVTGDVAAVAADIEDRIRGMQFPLEYHAELLGDYQVRQEARWAFIGVSIAVALGIFLILQAAFASWRMAAVAFLALPAALVGGALAGLVDGDLTIGSIAGFFGVFALAARHCVLFVKRCQGLEDREGQAFGSTLVARAARERFAPVITTVLLTAVVFLPLLVLGRRAGLEVAGPAAAVVLGGLVTTALVNLFVLPALYLRFGSRSDAAREDLDFDLDFSAFDTGKEDAHVPSGVDA